jgi:hypothetical protein
VEVGVESAADVYGHSPRLTAALSALWTTMADDYGLLPDLAFDAVMSRARSDEPGETARCLPRLVNLMVDGELPIPEAVEVIALLEQDIWTVRQRDLAVEVLDAWWFETLLRHPGEHPPHHQPDDVLGLLSRTRFRMVRWLQVWLLELDGPPAVHLASAIDSGLNGPAWDGQDDARNQVLAWARTETIVNGLALIGTTHVESALMSRVLDRLVELPGTDRYLP